MNSAATEDIELTDGSACELMHPRAWNGYLVSQPDLFDDEIDRAFQSWLAVHGFASVRHTRDVRGWDIERGIANHREATALFRERFGAPPAGEIVLGASMGGLLARILVEQDPDSFAGALPMDGGGAGLLATFNRGFDMAFVVSQLLAPEAPIVLADAPSVAEQLTRLAAVIAAARRNASGVARLALAASIGAVPVWSDPTRAEPPADDPLQEADHLISGMASTIGPAYGFRALVEELVGGVVIDNVHVDYAQSLQISGASGRVQVLYDEAGLSLADDLQALADAPRVAASSAAVDSATRGAVVEGRVRCPVFVLKSLGDPDASVAEENAYLAAASRAGSRDLVRVGYVHSAGHVNATLAERAAALSVLVERIESGGWQGLTSAPALNERAARIAADARWDFTLRRAPGLDTRVSRFVSCEPWPYPRA
ncbi:hypothetical protein FBY40_0060 [Microbacterium sp. SLBN-154]|uniref:hypothetical protein n=1 Tax=Microbacterium sp. SLBN-154 TaxID=2768458 RepID=UPI001154C887|nr:hypothetical protein [Microbacterium sp. SLBN-154]TQK17583.1 hypothetical protein FBY40_0060 [Microbacterium sp. SLBN-154]